MVSAFLSRVAHARHGRVFRGNKQDRGGGIRASPVDDACRDRNPHIRAEPMPSSADFNLHIAVEHIKELVRCVAVVVKFTVQLGDTQHAFIGGDQRLIEPGLFPAFYCVSQMEDLAGFELRRIIENRRRHNPSVARRSGEANRDFGNERKCAM